MAERLTTDNPKNNTETMLNYAYVKDKQVILRYGDGEENINLCEYISRLAANKLCHPTPEEVLDGECMECDCELAILYWVAVQAAELRGRLAKYEDLGSVEDIKEKLADLDILRDEIQASKCFYFVSVDEHEELSQLKQQIADGELSDGYHTFNELYHHRAVLFSVICNLDSNIAWKAKKHDDGTMFDNMFIVGINTPFGSATYHYDIDSYWNYFNVKELEFAPKWDGHTPPEAITRLWNYGINPLGLDKEQAEAALYPKCPICGKDVYVTLDKSDFACSDKDCPFAVGKKAYEAALREGKQMVHSESKYRITRKPHICKQCGKEIPVETKCFWYKAVAFNDSEVGSNRWEEGYICPQCDAENAEIDMTPPFVI